MENELEFENQRPKEKVIIFSRQHPWVLARPAFYLLIVGVLLFLVLMIWKINLNSVLVATGVVLLSLVYLIINWYAYANDIFVLTDQRLIKIDQKGLFSRRVSETELDNVYNINYEVKGIIKSLLNFGDIKISTVGDDVSTIIIANVGNPHLVQEKVMDLHNKYKTKVYSN